MLPPPSIPQIILINIEIHIQKRKPPGLTQSVEPSAQDIYEVFIEKKRLFRGKIQGHYKYAFSYNLINPFIHILTLDYS